MPSYLLTYNPLKWDWTDLSIKLKEFKTMGFTEMRWSCGNTKRIKAEDRIFLTRLGKEPRGIFASGIVLRGSYEDMSWTNNKKNSSLYVHFKLDKFTNPNSTVLITRENLKDEFPLMTWDTQVSGIRIPDKIAVKLSQKLSRASSDFAHALKEVSGVIEFSLASNSNAHAMFQAWRRLHPDGFFLNCKTRNNTLLHHVECRHPGGTEWQASSDSNLGKTLKICSTDYSELKALAAQRGLSVRDCKDCINEVLPDDEKSHPSLSLQEVENDFSEKLNQSKELSSQVRKMRLDNAPKQPQTIKVQTSVFLRNPDVVVEVLTRSKGFCESCRKKAPFVRSSDNSPYLEVHHIIRLADGGYDTIENALAICPNCHRKAHYGYTGTL